MRANRIAALAPNKQGGFSVLLEVAPCLTIRGWSILSICKRLPGSRRRSRFQPRTHTSACPITRIGRDAAQSNGLSRPPYLLRPRFGPSHSHVETVKECGSVRLGSMTAWRSRPQEKTPNAVRRKLDPTGDAHSTAQVGHACQRVHGRAFNPKAAGVQRPPSNLELGPKLRSPAEPNPISRSDDQ